MINNLCYCYYWKKKNKKKNIFTATKGREKKWRDFDSNNRRSYGTVPRVKREGVNATLKYIVRDIDIPKFRDRTFTKVVFKSFEKETRKGEGRKKKVYIEEEQKYIAFHESYLSRDVKVRYEICVWYDTNLIILNDCDIAFKKANG